MIFEGMSLRPSEDGTKKRAVVAGLDDVAIVRDTVEQRGRAVISKWSFQSVGPIIFAM